MIESNCKKCGAELFLREGYCVCNNCGEIYALPKEEEIEEILTEEENIIEEPVASEIEETVKSETDEIEEVEEIEEETQEAEDIEESEETEEKEVFAPVVEAVEKKKSKASAIIWAIVAIIGVAFAGYFAVSHLVIDTTNKDAEVFEKDEYAVEETLPEEEPEEIKEEVVSEEEEEPKEKIKEEKDIPAKKPVQNKKPVAKQPPVVKETPAIAYRIRKSADDSDTQIGAFSDVERAKSFASAHAADGYKVFDMSGNLVYQP